MKESAKYVAAILATLVAAFLLSWCAVYSFWIAAHLFHSVPAVRFCNAVGSFILLPARVLFWLAGDLVDQSTPLTDPVYYAAINATLVGTLAYTFVRQRMFGPRRS